MWHDSRKGTRPLVVPPGMHDIAFSDHESRRQAGVGQAAPGSAVEGYVGIGLPWVYKRIVPLPALPALRRDAPGQRAVVRRLDCVHYQQISPGAAPLQLAPGARCPGGSVAALGRGMAPKHANLEVEPWRVKRGRSLRAGRLRDRAWPSQPSSQQPNPSRPALQSARKLRRRTPGRRRSRLAACSCPSTKTSGER